MSTLHSTRRLLLATAAALFGAAVGALAAITTPGNGAIGGPPR
ncbi:hypothetical protein SAMN04515671_1730 [Nakamurella panacisegetis]|uniref:Uncharacterized protein n=1 Tax=Nakamurella panacisegetis TaxID=1090615 RepID=A0A1H0LN50_9ACTN|nr:hypothetical protein [Nakamurella panacisegetis]SDO69587.1 hypothetical protein SAMN04515671_1730 [Nakamurella panacisegetis]